MTTTAKDGRALVDEAQSLFDRLGREDLEARLGAAKLRADRATALVCLIGAYKSGKSSLVNSILGSDVSPVHHHEPTAIPVLVEYGDALSHTVVGAAGRAEPVNEETARQRAIAPDEDDRMLHIAVPSPVAKLGIAFLDTPGLGGLTGEAAQASLLLARDADAVLFVSEGATELSRRDIEYLHQVHDSGVWAAVVVTKADLFPHWRQLVELNRTHVAGLEGVQVYPVSSAVRHAALGWEDGDLNRGSGIPALLEAISEAVGLGDEEAAVMRTLDVADGLVFDLRQDLNRLAETLASPDVLDRLRSAERSMADLMAAGSKWRSVLGQGIGELRRNFERELDHDLEEWERVHKERLDEIDPATAWESFEEDFLAGLQAIIDGLVDRFDAGLRALAEQIAVSIDDEAPDLENDWRSTLPDPGAEWQQRVGDRRKKKPNPLTTGLQALRGAQGGLITMGMLGGLAGLSMVGPLAAGVGVVFAAKQLREFTKGSLEQRRAEATMLLARLKARIHREMAYFAGEAFSTASTTLDGHFGDRIKAIHGELTSTIDDAKRVLSESEEERSRHLTAVREAVAAAAALSDRISTFIEAPG